MTKLSEVKQVTNISWPVVGSVAVGIALFGGLMFAIRKAPKNALTKPVKEAADAIS